MEEKSAELRQKVIIGLLFSCTPFTALFVWYIGHVLPYLSAVLFICIGLKLSWNLNNKPLRTKIISSVLSILFLLYVLGLYPAFLATILIIPLGKLTVESVEVLDNNNSIKSVYNSFKYTFWNVFSSIVLYKLILIFLDKIGVLCDMQNIKVNSVSEILSDIPSVLCAAFQQLVQYKACNMPNSITVLFFVLIILSCLIIIYKIFASKVNKKEKIACALLIFTALFLIIFFSKLPLLLSVENWLYVPRIDFCGLMFIRAFFVFFVFRFIKSNILKNIAYIVCCVLIYICVVSCFSWQKSFKLAFDIEKQLYSHIAHDITKCKEFDYSKEYGIVSIGRLEPIRPKLHPYKSRKIYSFELGDGPMVLGFNIARVISLSEPSIKLRDDASGNLKVQFNESKINGADFDKYKNEIKLSNLSEIEPYPSKKYIKIMGDKIFIFLDEKSVEFLKIVKKNL